MAESEMDKLLNHLIKSNADYSFQYNNYSKETDGVKTFEKGYRSIKFFTHDLVDNQVLSSYDDYTHESNDCELELYEKENGKLGLIFNGLDHPSQGHDMDLMASWVEECLYDNMDKLIPTPQNQIRYCMIDAHLDTLFYGTNEEKADLHWPDDEPPLNEREREYYMQRIEEQEAIDINNPVSEDDMEL